MRRRRSHRCVIRLRLRPLEERREPPPDQAPVNYRPSARGVIDRKAEQQRRRSDDAETGGKKKSIGSVSINLASAGLIAALNWENRIVYLGAVIP